MITEQSRRLAVDLARIAEAKFKAAQVSQQDFLRAELEVQNVDAELIRLRQDLQVAQARVARLLHISPDTPVAALANWPRNNYPTIYSASINGRSRPGPSYMPNWRRSSATVTRWNSPGYSTFLT